MKPIYLFSGFLDCGKTTAIIECLENEYFNAGERNMLIVLEDGDIKYSDAFLKKTNSFLITLDDLNYQKLQELKNKYSFDRIIVEFNGLMNEISFLEELGEDFELAQSLCIFNGALFKRDLINWKQFVYNHIFKAELAIFNRMDDVDPLFIRNNLKAINPKIEIIFEKKDGTIFKYDSHDLFKDASILNLNDYDLGLWYIDALDNYNKYFNSHIKFKAEYKNKENDYDIFIRKAMVCCDDDLANLEFICQNSDNIKLIKGANYALEGIILPYKDSYIIKLIDINILKDEKLEYIYFN